jgi:uncharacterized membrane protein
VSPEERHRAEILHAAVEISRFSGPLPHPEDLAKYEQVLPGSADRIISMAEHQAEHRRNLEKTVILSNVTLQQWGLACAFILAMTAISGGIWLSLRGMSGVGLTAIISALAALVGVFVYGKSEQKKELREKAGALPPERPAIEDSGSPGDAPTRLDRNDR